VGRKPKQIKLSDVIKISLHQLHKTDKRHCVRQRSQIILLKADGFISASISKIVGYNETTVNSWIKRFESQGIAGLYTTKGQGNKPILVKDDLAVVRASVIKERQRLSQAKILIEQELDKQFSQRTLNRFLKLMTVDINELEEL
jgi:transposase